MFFVCVRSLAQYEDSQGESSTASPFRLGLVSFSCSVAGVCAVMHDVDLGYESNTAFFKENKKDESSRVILDGRCGLLLHTANVSGQPSLGLWGVT